MQSSGIIQSSKRLLFAALFLAILVPLFFTLAIRSSPKYQIGMLLFFQSLVCVVITLLLLWLTLYCKKSYLAPFTVAYALMSALIFLATMGDRIISEGVGQYCAPMLWGSYIREGRGLGSFLVYLAVVGCYFVSLARSRRAA